MPVFMDTHSDMAELSPDMRKMVTERVRNGDRDAHGVIDRGIIMDREGRKLHCILEAPDVDAVMRHHQSLNVPIAEETIHQADVILR